MLLAAVKSMNSRYGEVWVKRNLNTNIIIQFRAPSIESTEAHEKVRHADDVYFKDLKSFFEKYFTFLL